VARDPQEGWSAAIHHVRTCGKVGFRQGLNPSRAWADATGVALSDLRKSAVRLNEAQINSGAHVDR